MKYIFFTLILLFASCKMFDSFDEEPMFLSLDQASLGEYPLESEPTHKIQDMWVYADGFSIGVFELPAEVPVLGSSEQVTLDIRAGIRNNGITLSPKEYPFYKSKTLVLDFQENTTQKIDLDFEYVDNISIPFFGSFEDINPLTLDLDGDDSSVIYRSNETPYGGFCGKIDVTPENTLFQQAGFEIFQTEDFGISQVYIEIDYKCEVPFIIGYIGHSNGQLTSEFHYVVAEQDEWSKLYLDMSNALNGGRYDAFQILIAGTPQEGTGSVWIDNFKVIHFDN